MRTLGFGNVIHCIDDRESQLRLQEFGVDVTVSDCAMKPMARLQFIKIYLTVHRLGRTHDAGHHAYRQYLAGADYRSAYGLGSDIMAKAVTPELASKRILYRLQQLKTHCPVIAPQEDFYAALNKWKFLSYSATAFIASY